MWPVKYEGVAKSVRKKGRRVEHIQQKTRGSGSSVPDFRASRPGDDGSGSRRTVGIALGLGIQLGLKKGMVAMVQL